MPEYTQEAYDDLQKNIKSVEENLKEARLRMGATAQADTWHDNAGFDQANEDVRNLMSQLSQLHAARSNAVVVESSKSGTIEVGSKVTVEFEDGDIETVIVDGRSMSSTAGVDEEVMRVSTASPMGAALIGHRQGDLVSYRVPNGSEIVLSVVEVA